MRTMFVWRSASTLPTVIVSAASTQMNGSYTPSAGCSATNSIVSRPTKPAAFDATDRNAVTGVRRALVGVGRPRVERHRRHLEAEPDDHERDGDHLHRQQLVAVEGAAMSVSLVEPVVP